MRFKDFNSPNQHGASLLEYSILIALIALVAFGAVTYFGDQNKDSLENSAECIRAATNGEPITPECQ